MQQESPVPLLLNARHSELCKWSPCEWLLRAAAWTPVYWTGLRKNTERTSAVTSKWKLNVTFSLFLRSLNFQVHEGSALSCLPLDAKHKTVSSSEQVQNKLFWKNYLMTKCVFKRVGLKLSFYHFGMALDVRHCTVQFKPVCFHSFSLPTNQQLMFGFRILCVKICDQGREQKDSAEDMVNDLQQPRSSVGYTGS